MARRRSRGRSRTRYISRITRRARRPRRDETKRYLMKAAKGAGIGLAVAIPLTFAARHFSQPMLMEIGQRGGAIAASAFGGTVGQAAYQGADAIFDRYVQVGGNAISGTGGVGV